METAIDSRSQPTSPTLIAPCRSLITLSVLNRPSTPLATCVFGATNSPQFKKKLRDSWKDLLGPVERTFLNDSAATSALKEELHSPKAGVFVSFSTDPAQKKRWELSANARVITPNGPGPPGAVEADLRSLSRDFGACIAIPLLFGQDFLDRCPRLLDDFWKFDNDLFPLMMIGVASSTPLKCIKDGVAARSRLLQEMETLYRRVDHYHGGAKQLTTGLT
ncbi:hypothetical protein AYL99_10454 [Fonsecaea erecta]|uniref:Uncharacterized protein n=1 Tax=Fonsecaea erecta TaxID=1367422 RepID=A0A178Z7K9_9EURO|nr:hypothetical protein AYL99_10454 [Fonsecaea erecta]OAP55481.1 hypothetical protein AYL99_10454 [Fonsecaea erecta]